MRVAEAKTRRLLGLAGAMLLALAPRGVGDAPVDRAGVRALPPRPGSIRIGSAPLASQLEQPLELAAPDLVGLALRTELVGGWERALPDAEPGRGVAAAALSDLASLDTSRLASQPVAEPPAAWLLSVAAGAWLATRRTRQPPKRGSRFSRNASMPSMASRSSRLSAITAPASR